MKPGRRIMSEEMEEDLQPHLKSESSKSNSLKIFAGVVGVLSLIAVVIGVTQQSSANGQVSDAIATADANTSSTDSVVWIPDGYTVFDINPEIAQDPNYSSGTCTGNGYCWIYQIATKSDCSKVVGTLEMHNGSTVIGTISGEVSDVSSGTPTLLEINSGDNSDVDSSTRGHLTSIECTP
jgi:hypothetical protein